MKPEDLGLSVDEFGELCILLSKVVKSVGGVFGQLDVHNEETGEAVAMHIDFHDAVLCECARLDFVERTIQ